MKEFAQNCEVNHFDKNFETAEKILRKNVISPSIFFPITRFIARDESEYEKSAD